MAILQRLQSGKIIYFGAKFSSAKIVAKIILETPYKWSMQTPTRKNT